MIGGAGVNIKYEMSEHQQLMLELNQNLICNTERTMHFRSIKPQMKAYNSIQNLNLLTVGCSCAFDVCSITLGSASPNNTAGTNALRRTCMQCY